MKAATFGLPRKVTFVSRVQANRSKKKAPYEFGEGQQLPPTIPHGFNEKLSNRIFKRRVIDMVNFPSRQSLSLAHLMSVFRNWAGLQLLWS